MRRDRRVCTLAVNLPEVLVDFQSSTSGQNDPQEVQTKYDFNDLDNNVTRHTTGSGETRRVKKRGRTFTTINNLF